MSGGEVCKSNAALTGRGSFCSLLQTAVQGVAILARLSKSQLHDRLAGDSSGQTRYRSFAIP
jgi:hypothetical protein